MGGSFPSRWVPFKGDGVHRGEKAMRMIQEKNQGEPRIKTDRSSMSSCTRPVPTLVRSLLFLLTSDLSSPVLSVLALHPVLVLVDPHPGGGRGHGHPAGGRRARRPRRALPVRDGCAPRHPVPVPARGQEALPGQRAGGTPSQRAGSAQRVRPLLDQRLLRAPRVGHLPLRGAGVRPGVVLRLPRHARHRHLPPQPKGRGRAGQEVPVQPRAGAGHDRLSGEGHRRRHRAVWSRLRRAGLSPGQEELQRLRQRVLRVPHRELYPALGQQASAGSHGISFSFPPFPTFSPTQSSLSASRCGTSVCLASGTPPTLWSRC